MIFKIPYTHKQYYSLDIEAATLKEAYNIALEYEKESNKNCEGFDIEIERDINYIRDIQENG